ncbi:Baseplate protein [uncultured Defluviicoccus sp.]|uniref:Baseplate protein n=1 Tax=metagenome TaxID=256318 RepID=A0A380TBA0_9ZZZZ|nr:Baseplate protein [uncultured Defluviicoccus sp.]
MDELDAGKEFLGREWGFPFAITPDRGQIAMTSYEQSVRQSIHIILATSRGQRVMRPDFGCGIHDLVFQAINTALIAQMQRDVTDALRTFEPRIDLDRVTVDQSRIADGRLDVIVDFRIRTTNQPGNLVYPFYFREGS